MPINDSDIKYEFTTSSSSKLIPVPRIVLVRFGQMRLLNSDDVSTLKSLIIGGTERNTDYAISFDETTYKIVAQHPNISQINFIFKKARSFYQHPITLKWHFSNDNSELTLSD